MPVYVTDDWSAPQGRMRWRRACASLESLSIITTTEDGGSLIISAHSLVHAWALERQNYRDRSSAWLSAATVLSLSCQPYQYDHMLFLRQHVRACVSHNIEEYMQHMYEKETAYIFIELLTVFKWDLNYNMLDSLMQRIRPRLEDQKLDQEDLLKLKYFAAQIAWDKANFQEAVDIFEKLIAIRSRDWEEDDDRLLDLQIELAYVYVYNNQVEEGLELLEYVLKMVEHLEEDDFRRLGARQALAYAYSRKGRTNEAVKMLEQIVKVNETLNEFDGDRLQSQHELGHAYLENKQYEEAVKMLEHVVKIDNVTLTEDHS
ncbi:MAG: hypothetical protein Q9191_008537, partial [Dirinaria sp. TL-2023a]